MRACVCVCLWEGGGGGGGEGFKSSAEFNLLTNINGRVRVR